VDIDTLREPVAASLGVGALDHQLVQHRLDDLGYGPDIGLGLNLVSAGRTGALAVWLWSPGMVETCAAEVVFARELNGLIKGRVADQADEVAVGRRDVLEGLHLGRQLDASALSVLR
jgi:hypothetical protein